jgi:ribosomal protein S2
VIPANDDATKSIELIVNYIAQAIEEGKVRKKTKKKAKS